MTGCTAAPAPRSHPSHASTPMTHPRRVRAERTTPELWRGAGEAAHLLGLLGELLRDVGLGAAEEVGGHHVAQHDGALVGRRDRDRGRAGVGALLDRQPELRLEDWQRAELAGEDKVKQGPELREAVLDGRPGQDDAVGRADLQPPCLVIRLRCQQWARQLCQAHRGAPVRVGRGAPVCRGA